MGNPCLRRSPIDSLLNEAGTRGARLKRALGPCSGDPGPRAIIGAGIFVLHAGGGRRCMPVSAIMLSVRSSAGSDACFWTLLCPTFASMIPIAGVLLYVRYAPLRTGCLDHRLGPNSGIRVCAATVARWSRTLWPSARLCISLPPQIWMCPEANGSYEGRWSPKRSAPE